MQQSVTASLDFALRKKVMHRLFKYAYLGAKQILIMHSVKEQILMMHSVKEQILEVHSVKEQSLVMTQCQGA